MNLPVLALASAAFIAPALGGDAFTVAPPGQSADFHSVQAAIDQASEGDVLLIASGYYPEAAVVIDGKSLDLIRSTPGPFQLDGQIEVSNLAADQEVSLVGLSSQGYGTKLILTGCQGHVRVERMGNPLVDQHPYDAREILVLDCDDVLLVDCHFQGARGFDGQHPSGDGGDGGPALFVSQSNVGAYGCRFAGGPGGWGDCIIDLFTTGNGGDGGPGVLVENGGLFLDDGNVLAGGQAGFYYTDTCIQPGQSGDEGKLSEVQPGSLLRSSTSPAAVLIGPDTLTEGESSSLRVAAPAGEKVLLLTSTQSFWRDLGPFVGTLAIQSPFTLTPMGSVPGSGLLTYPITAPFLGASDLSRAVRLQAVIVGPGYRYLSNPKSLVYLDQSL